jgi:membrane protein DedA with SNARE-associated domain
LAPLLARYGYLALFGMVGVESFGIPAPGQSILIVAAALTSSGGLDLVAVAVVAFAAATLGDNASYAVGRYGGRALVARFGRYVGMTEGRVARWSGRFSRHGAKLVVLARFVDGLRQSNGVIAGMAGMTWRRFALLNCTGALLWVALWASVGWILGRHAGALYPGLHR